MIGIHPIHRRLAELTLKAKQRGGYHQLPASDQSDLYHCLQVNLDLVLKLDLLKELSVAVYQLGDTDWQHELCKQIDEIEAKMT